MVGDKHQNKGGGWRTPPVPACSLQAGQALRRVRPSPPPASGLGQVGRNSWLGRGPAPEGALLPAMSVCRWTGVRYGPSCLRTPPVSESWGTRPLAPPPEQHPSPASAAEPSSVHSRLSSGHLRPKGWGSETPLNSERLCDRSMSKLDMKWAPNVLNSI